MSQFVLSFVTCHRVCNTRNKNGVTRVNQEGYSSREWLIQLYFCTFCKIFIFFWTVWAMPEFVLSFETYHRICNTRNENGVTRVEQEGYSSREWLIQLYFCTFCKFFIFFWTVWAMPEFVLSFVTYHRICNTRNKNEVTHVEQEGYSSREWLIQLYFCNICKFIIFFWTVWARSEFVLSFMTHRWLCNTSNTTFKILGFYNKYLL
jgi:ribosomal silencing factor RsfS